MANKWLIYVVDEDYALFMREVIGDDNARSLFHIKQVQILTELGKSTELVKANPIEGNKRGLVARMPNNQLVYMVQK